MIETAMLGNSRTMRMNGSFEMRKAMTRSLARTVALRGTSPKIAISPTKSLAPSVATITGPAGVSRMTSAWPSMIRYAASAGSPCCIKRLPGSKPTRSLMNASSFSLAGSISAKIGTRRSNSNSCLRLIAFLPSFWRCLSACSFGGHKQGHQRPVALKLDRRALLLQLAVAEHNDPVEIAGEARPMQYPNDPAACKLLTQPAHHSRLRLPIERRGRLVENQKVGALDHCASDPGLLPIGERQPRAAGTDIVVEPDIDDGLPKRQRVDDFGEHRRNADRRISLAIGNLAKQNVVLHRGRRVITLGIEELDLRLCLGRQISPKRPTCLEQALLHRFVDDIEPVAGRDQPEGQGEEFGAIRPPKPRRSPATRTSKNGCKFRQIGGADKAELLEELVIGRQVGEQFDHRFSDLLAGCDKVIDQPHFFENLDYVHVVRERLEVESRTDRGSEQQVFRDRGILIEPVCVVGLDEFGDLVFDQPAGERLARFQEPRGRFAVGFGIKPPAQSEVVDTLLQVKSG